MEKIKINNNHSFKMMLFKKLFLVIILFVAIVSCNEDIFLNEVPLDFYSPENSFVTNADFESAVQHLYVRHRDDIHFAASSGRQLAAISWQLPAITHPSVHLGGTSIDWAAEVNPLNTALVYSNVWRHLYRLIYDANVIIGRADAEASELTPEQSNRVKAEAAYFRGYAYKLLANLYGGVPITLQETTAPKRDYTRATRQAVYEQSIEDLEFALGILPDIDEVADTRLNKLVANYYLAELYVTMERWQDAINAASAVIDHPATVLMTERFGTRVDDERFGGDVYWDLFRRGNQARNAGNTETIWRLPHESEALVDGGGYLHLERRFIPRLWRAIIVNEDGSTTPLTPGPNSIYTYGRGSSGQRTTHYFNYTLWEKSGFDEDIRNSEHNIIRDYQVRHPDSDYDGQWVVADNVPIQLQSDADTTRNFHIGVGKAATPGNHPDYRYVSNPRVEGEITSGATLGGRTYRDDYALRLAEAYLMRAEAYLGAGDLTAAAEDINVVRRRSEAPEIDASMVDIDYILDERIRELHLEELHLFTTNRLGLTVERAKKWDPFFAATMQPHHNLWPIPFSEIEKNSQAVLEQNPGY